MQRNMTDEGRNVRRIAGLEEVFAAERGRTFTTETVEHIFCARFILHVPGAADRMFSLPADKLPACSCRMRHGGTRFSCNGVIFLSSSRTEMNSKMRATAVNTVYVQRNL